MSGYDVVGWAFSFALAAVIVMTTILASALALAWTFDVITTKKYRTPS